MNKSLFMNELKDTYIQILQDFFAKNDRIVSMDIQLDLDQDFEEQINCLRDAVSLLKKAREADDKIATQAALLHISSYAMGLSSFFGNIDSDATKLLRAPQWPAIPENYKIPEHYHFPHK
ncbi:hypothetical protein [Sodalis sp. RH16]|uniref:hypothetical protein n=1 Tax=Sodalis sp. RH16 TaxID=3394331 RepID=UPI0039B63C71